MSDLEYNINFIQQSIKEYITVSFKYIDENGKLGNFRVDPFVYGVGIDDQHGKHHLNGHSHFITAGEQPWRNFIMNNIQGRVKESSEGSFYPKEIEGYDQNNPFGHNSENIKIITPINVEGNHIVNNKIFSPIADIDSNEDILIKPTELDDSE